MGTLLNKRYYYDLGSNTWTEIAIIVITYLSTRNGTQLLIVFMFDFFSKYIRESAVLKFQKQK